MPRAPDPGSDGDRPDAAADPAERAEVLALRALAWLAEDPDRLSRFMALSGTNPDSLRTGVSDPAMLGGVLDHLLQDERLLRAFAEDADVVPDAVAAARRDLPGRAVDWDPDA